MRSIQIDPLPAIEEHYKTLGGLRREELIARLLYANRYDESYLTRDDLKYVTNSDLIHGLLAHRYGANVAYDFTQSIFTAHRGGCTVTVYFSEVIEFALNHAGEHRDDHTDQVDLVALEERTINYFNLTRVEANVRDLRFFIRKALEHHGMEIKS